MFDWLLPDPEELDPDPDELEPEPDELEPEPDDELEVEEGFLMLFTLGAAVGSIWVALQPSRETQNHNRRRYFITALRRESVIYLAAGELTRM